MAYNSDGYIMLDFSMVDFSKTNQTIEGLYKRCVDIIGTNKFVLVINANRKTPLPSAVSFTNNQYVIESVLFNFTISNNDNLYIKKQTPASELIDDNHMTQNTTWSSYKINSAILNGIKPYAFNKINGKLIAGNTIITFTDTILINSNTEFDFYTSKFGVVPINAQVNEHTLTLTFDEQIEDIDIVVRVYNYDNV